MRRKVFDERIRLFKEGDRIKLILRGMYGTYQREGKFKKVDDRGFVHLDKGLPHSYRKIITIYDFRGIERS